MAVQIRILRSGDESALTRVAPDVFDNAVDPALAREFLSDPRHHIAVAVDDGMVVGFASGVRYLHPDKPEELWINEVAVAPSHQRQRIGHAVLAALFAEGLALGCRQAWVLTDRTNVAANALYASLGGIEGAEGLGAELRGFMFVLPAG
jgi:ribosomal protein S18 acetylase RimI-like enzyme